MQWINQLRITTTKRVTFSNESDEVKPATERLPELPNPSAKPVRDNHSKAVNASQAVKDWRKKRINEGYDWGNDTEEIEPIPQKATQASRLEKLLQRAWILKAETKVEEVTKPDMPVNNIKPLAKKSTIQKSWQRGGPDRSTICYVSKIPQISAWKGLGLNEEQPKNVVELLRARDSISRISTQCNFIGILTLTLSEVKGLPRHDADRSIFVFSEIKLFASPKTTKPSWEGKTQITESEKLLSRSHRVKWNMEFRIPVISEDSVLELEVFQTPEVVSELPTSHGIFRFFVRDVMEESLADAWFTLKRRDGGLKTSYINFSLTYSTETKQLQLEQQRPTAAQEMPKENPNWISSWDVLSILKFKAEQKAARKMVLEAIEKDTIEALQSTMQAIFDLGIEDEQPSKEATAQLKILIELKSRQDKVKAQLRGILTDSSLSPFWLAKALSAALTEAQAASLTLDCEEVKEGLQVFEKVKEQTTTLLDDG